MHFINTSDLAQPDWRFLEPVSSHPDISWSFHYGRARNVLERIVPRPSIGRWRAALTAALEARKRPDAILVSHLPRMAAATSLMRRRLSPATRHIAFAFNFTDLPQGADRARLTSAFRDIDEFVVFSNFEISLYSDYFGIPAERIRFLPWAMDPPVPGSTNPVMGQGGYISSIGGEGRDYALLARAMRALPDTRLVIVARPRSIAGIDFPPNVTIFTNLPAPVTWRIAADSLGMVIPLKSDRTACGHITMVGAQLLGLPLVMTRAQSNLDYVKDGTTARMVTAGDTDDMLAALKFLQHDRDAAQKIGAEARRRAKTQNALSTWLRYFEDDKVWHGAGMT